MIKKIVIDFTTGTLTYPVIHYFVWYKNGVKVEGTPTVVSTTEFNYDINGEVLNYTTPQAPYSASYKFENIMKEGTLYYWAANNLTCNITITLPDNFDWDKFRIQPTNNNNSTRYYCKEIVVHYFDESETEVYTDIKKRPDELTAGQFDNTFVIDFNNPSKYYLKTPYNKMTMTLNTATNYSAGMTQLKIFYNSKELIGTVKRGVVQGGKYVLEDGREIYVSASSNYSGYYVDLVFNETGYGFTGADAAASRPLKLYINWFDDSILIDKLTFQISGNMGNENRTISSYTFELKDRESDALYKIIEWENLTNELNTYIRTEEFYIHEYYIEDGNKRYIYNYNRLEDVTGTEKTFTSRNNLTKSLISTLTSPKIKCKYPFVLDIEQLYNKWFKYKFPIKAIDLKNISNFTAIADYQPNYLADNYGVFFAFVHNGNFLTTKMNPLKFDVNDPSFTELQFLTDNVAVTSNLKNIVTNLKTYAKKLNDNDELELWFLIFNTNKYLNNCSIRSFDIVKSIYDLFKPDNTLISRVRKDCINIYPTTANTYKLNWYEEENTTPINNPKPLRTMKIYTYNTYGSYSCCMYGLGFDDYSIEITEMVEEGTTFTGTITLTKGDEVITGKATLLNNNSYGDLSTIFKTVYTGAVADSPRGAGLTLVIELEKDITFKYFKISNFYSASCYNSNIIFNGYNSTNALEVQKLICEDILGNAVNHQEIYDIWN